MIVASTIFGSLRQKCVDRKHQPDVARIADQAAGTKEEKAVNAHLSRCPSCDARRMLWKKWRDYDLRIRPNLVPLLDAGQAALREKDHDKVVALMREAFRIDPQRAATYHMLAAALFKQGRYDQAAHAAHMSRMLGRERPDLILCLALSLVFLHKYEYGAVLLEDVLHRHPERGRIQGVLAMCRYQLGQRGDAMTLARRTLKEFGDEAHSLFVLALADYDAKRLTACVTKMKRAISIDMTNPSFYSLMGCALAGLEKFFEALGCFWTAASLAPNADTHVLNASLCYLYQGSLDLASDVLKSFDSRLPNVKTVRERLEFVEGMRMLRPSERLRAIRKQRLHFLPMVA